MATASHSCGCAGAPPMRFDVSRIEDFRRRLIDHNRFAVPVEGKTFVTEISGRPALVTDIESSEERQRSIFVYESAGRVFGIDVDGKFAETREGRSSSLRIDFEIRLAPLEDRSPVWRFTGHVQCDDIAVPTTHMASFRAADEVTAALLGINWAGLFACAPQCISCWKSLPCWLACAAGCVAANI